MLQTTPPPEETLNAVIHQLAKRQECLSCVWPEDLSVSPDTAIPLHPKALKQEEKSLHSTRRGKITGPPLQYPLLWCRQLQDQAPALLCFHTADDHPKHSTCLFLALRILDYSLQWSSLRSQSQLSSPPSFPIGCPQFPPLSQLFCPIATSHLHWPLLNSSCCLGAGELMPASTEDWATDTAAPEDRRKTKQRKPLLQGQASAATWHWPAAGTRRCRT